MDGSSSTTNIWPLEVASFGTALIIPANKTEVRVGLRRGVSILDDQLGVVGGGREQTRRYLEQCCGYLLVAAFSREARALPRAFQQNIRNGHGNFQTRFKPQAGLRRAGRIEMVASAVPEK